MPSPDLGPDGNWADLSPDAPQPDTGSDLTGLDSAPDEASPTDTPCVPDCEGRVCGDDGCGGSCGLCDGGCTCSAQGQCQGACIGPLDDFVAVGEGPFQMGCNDGVDSSCENDELPYHEVYLAAFQINRNEITVGEYARCLDAKVCSAPSCDWGTGLAAAQPVRCVTWNQARAYCTWRSARLCTEAEWEKASRGTDGAIYPWGNANATCALAVMGGPGGVCGNEGPADVCSKPAGNSPYGVCDLAGNLWEWVNDYYQWNYYESSTYQNPQGPTTGGDRVIRGGNLWDQASAMRASDRYFKAPATQAADLGFRCCK